MFRRNFNKFFARHDKITKNTLIFRAEIAESGKLAKIFLQLTVALLKERITPSVVSAFQCGAWISRNSYIYFYGGYPISKLSPKKKLAYQCK